MINRMPLTEEEWTEFQKAFELSFDQIEFPPEFNDSFGENVEDLFS